MYSDIVLHIQKLLHTTFCLFLKSFKAIIKSLIKTADIHIQTEIKFKVNVEWKLRNKNDERK